MKKRGYNQSEFIAKGLAAVLNKEIDTLSLVRTKNTETQTRKTRAERLQNMQEAFEVVNPEALSNKHILLLDDVITTGATMESCAITLLALPGVKVSVASLAYAID
jgi:ComF family protein